MPNLYEIYLNLDIICKFIEIYQRLVKVLYRAWENYGKFMHCSLKFIYFLKNFLKFYENWLSWIIIYFFFRFFLENL